MSSSTFPLSSSSEIPPDLARFLFENGAALIFLDFPRGSEFGIDCKSWTVGDKFKGLKMIPPGIHFVYFSTGRAPRIGFFHDFKEKEVLVRKWDAKNEDLLAADTCTEYTNNLHSLDPFLGPYPYEHYRIWFSLSDHLTVESITKLVPLDGHGRISSQAELVTMEEQLLSDDGNSRNVVDRQHPSRLRFVDEQGLPIMTVRPGFEIRFSEIPTRKTDCVSERTRNSLDASDRLERLLATFDVENQLLAEMQFAFICFLLGQVYEGFEQWKRLVHLLCSCRESLAIRQPFFLSFLMTLHFQLKQCPEDFFVDIVSRNNFLTITLANFFSNVDSTDNVGASLKEKTRKFKQYLTKRFKWDFEPLEDTPLVVSL